MQCSSGVSKCMVEECKYNNNHQCYAEGIEVRSSGTMSVSDSQSTCCQTFEPRE
ncbi:DUF1540 domain-containing protein [Peptococcaceae bacterium 1198_IL3148]